MLQRHATDVIALVSGTIFAGLAVVWILMLSETIDIEQAWIGGPVILIVAGVLGLLVTLTPNRTPVPVQELEEDSDAASVPGLDDPEDHQQP